MTLSEELNWRNFIQKSTLEDITLLDRGEWTFYIGFDASAPSQTIGNLTSMMVARTFLRHGRRAILLAGGATSLIGDPGGKDQERNLLETKAVAENIKKANGQFKTVFADFKDQITYVNNLDWYQDFKLLDFLRDVGKNFSITPLIQREFIASRLGPGGSGISYTEFSYTLLQGYDYLKLFEDHGCNLQLGGSDQWGNCLSGVDLIRRKHQKIVHALTLPLIINKATGKKFGKSEEQTVWLDPYLTHPSDFYQFWLNTNDEDVLDYLKIFTSLNKEAIAAIADSMRQNPEQRLAQQKLAEEATHLVHGADYLKVCQLFSQVAFTGTMPAENGIINILARQPDELQLVISQSKANLESIFDQLIDKIPALESRGQIKTMLAERSLKVITLIKDGAGNNLKRQTLENLSDLSNLSRISASQQPLLLIIGKNTMRNLKYST